LCFARAMLMMSTTRITTDGATDRDAPTAPPRRVYCWGVKCLIFIKIKQIMF
jgi:hypothetical protein